MVKDHSKKGTEIERGSKTKRDVENLRNERLILHMYTKSPSKHVIQCPACKVAACEGLPLGTLSAA